MAEPVVASRSGGERRPAATRRPALHHGDRLGRDEFERRYALRPDLNKAQLIEGVVCMPSPVSVAHSEPHAMVLGILLVYSAFTPGVRCYDNATVRLDLDNEPQPDVLLRIEPDHGGQSRVSEDGYIEGAPELIVEVAATSSSIDLHDKLRAYRRNGVREYVVWRTHERRIDWSSWPAASIVSCRPVTTARSRAGCSPVSVSPCPPFSPATSPPRWTQ